MSLHDAWAGLRHGGNLLSTEALDDLPPRGPASAQHADQLRAALVALPPDGPAGDALSELLNVVLESLCGLHVGWRKGSQVGAADAEKLLDGTSLKPRRVLATPEAEGLLVFTTPAPRIGVGLGRRPVAQVVEYLRRRSAPFALLTNGREWRFLWADTDSLAWVEWDADRWLDADLLSPSLEVFRRVISWPALVRNGTQPSPLLDAIRATRRGQAKLSKELGERVRRSVETLLRARAPVLATAWDHHAGSDLYVAACHLVMRLVVVLFAEARELLPVDNPVYHQAYGLRGLIDQLDRQSPERRRARHSAWPRLLALFRLLHVGSPHPALAVPAYGGDLFKAGDPSGDALQRALTLLESIHEPPDDDAVHRILVLLTRTDIRVRDGAVWRKVAAPVDFTELTSEYIGILYEGLLDYELRRAGAEPIVFLALGAQPALPLDRLEGMDDKTLVALVEKAKVKKATAEDGEEAEEEEAEEADDEEAEAENDTTAADTEPPELSLDDSRAAARARAVEWGRRAARVGKLVKKGKPTDPAYLRDLDAAAHQLIADVKLPGELFLVRWGGTRKGAGTFYTRPQLTMPTVRRTLEPLLYTGEGPARTVRSPEEILALKVCDPAMGSGSFLVAALRTLTAALVESLHVHGRLSAESGRTTIRCDAFPEADRSLPAALGGVEERLDALARRAVVEHCLYGVDRDPLAVELGRVALWVETLDRRLPFTFLDHKLRCGNALIGTWLDRFRDYPLLAFDRESPDKKWKGVHHPADVWHKALKARRDGVVAEQAALLGGQVPIFPGASDEELKAATDRVRRLYRELRAVPAGRPDERARIWRERIQADPALLRVREAFDTWCALWFWPLDRIAEAPGPKTLHAPSPAARETVKALRDRVRFFHWELEFPDVFTELGAGFSAVVGNPPWEIQKPNSKEFFSNLDPLYRAYGKQEALGVQRRMFGEAPTVEQDWLAYTGDFKDRGNFVRYAAEPFGDGKVGGHEGDVALGRGSGGDELHRKWRARRGRFAGTSDPAHPFRHQGSADLNTYKMFLEVGHALLQKGGQLGMVVPSGLYTDKGTGELRKLLLDGCAWRWLYGFENRDQIFDIHRSFKFCVCVAEKGGKTEAIHAAFMRHNLEDWAEAVGVLGYPAERVRGFSPKSLSVLEIRSDRDLGVLTRLYANGVLLGDEGPDGWGIETGREFHMTDDSNLFTPTAWASSNGCFSDEYGRWIRDDGEVLLPVYQGIMIGHFEPNRAAWRAGTGAQAEWDKPLPPGSPFKPQYIVSKSIATSEKPKSVRPRFLFRNIARTTDARTFVGSHVPAFPSGHSVAQLIAGNAEDQGTAVSAALCSLAFDWQVRGRVGGTNLSWAFLAEAVLPPPGLWVRCVQLQVLRLVGCSPTFADQWALARPPRELPWQRLWAITPHERLRLRCKLDAIVAVLYGLDRSDFAWILRDCDHPAARLSDKAFCRTLDPKGFWRVDKAQDPELRHTVLSLAAFDDLQRSIATAGSRDAGIQAFCDQNDGDGWMLPETLCLAELGLTRSVDGGVYDDRALRPQPVRARMGERFLDWQLAQTPEESWAECERHAKAILEGGVGPLPSAPVAVVPTTPPTTSPASKPQLSLFGPRN